MKSKELNMLAMRAFEEWVMRMDTWQCTLALLLQEALEKPSEKPRPRLLNSFRAEEPLCWREQLLEGLDVKVLNDRDKRQLVWVDVETGKELLVMTRDELEVALEDFEEQDGE